jgi:hypothetical protein
MNDTVSPSVAKRRSTRLIERPVLLAEDSGDDMQVDSEYEQTQQSLAESSSRGKKRNLKSRENKVNPQVKRFRGKRGWLKQLVEMPLDVLFEVCAILHLLMMFTISSDLRPPETS